MEATVDDLGNNPMVRGVLGTLGRVRTSLVTTIGDITDRVAPGTSAKVGGFLDATADSFRIEAFAKQIEGQCPKFAQALREAHIDLPDTPKERQEVYDSLGQLTGTDQLNSATGEGAEASNPILKFAENNPELAAGLFNEAVKDKGFREALLRAAQYPNALSAYADSFSQGGGAPDVQKAKRMISSAAQYPDKMLSLANDNPEMASMLISGFSGPEGLQGVWQDLRDGNFSQLFDRIGNFDFSEIINSFMGHMLEQIKGFTEGLGLQSLVDEGGNMFSVFRDATVGHENAGSLTVLQPAQGQTTPAAQVTPATTPDPTEQQRNQFSPKAGMS